MEFDEASAIAEIETAITGNPGTTEETPVPGTAATDPTKAEEFFEYILGNKTQKLPSSVQFALKHNGEVQKVPITNLINGYRQAQHAETKFTEANKMRGEFEKTKTDYTKLQETHKALENYKALQEWSEQLETKDPAGYKLLMDTIDRVKSGTYAATGTNPEFGALHATITDLRNELSGIKEWKGEFDKSQQEAKEQEDRKFVDSEIVEMKKKYPEISLDEKDQDGIALNTKIEVWGANKGYQNFTDAYHAYFRDKIADILVQRGKNEAIKGIKKDHAGGILARSSTPFVSGHPTEGNNGNRSYSELAKDALSEFEQLMGS